MRPIAIRNTLAKRNVAYAQFAALLEIQVADMHARSAHTQLGTGTGSVATGKLTVFEILNASRMRNSILL